MLVYRLQQYLQPFTATSAETLANANTLPIPAPTGWEEATWKTKMAEIWKIIPGAYKNKWYPNKTRIEQNDTLGNAS